MPHTVAAIVCCFFLILTHQCRAWSEAGHIVIAELAQRNLPEQTRNTLQEYANILLAGATQSRASWLKRYPAYSTFSYTAAWPDTVRGHTIDELFQHYHTVVPAELDVYRGKTTNNWHYTNRWFYSEQGIGIPKRCRNVAYRFSNNGELLPVIERLYSGFRRSSSEAQRAVLLALLIHLLSDLHQPLHNFTKVTNGCQHDRGGSGFCVIRDASEKCELNLHQWWDRGLGIFESPVNLQRMEEWINVTNGKGVVSAEPDFFRPNAWSEESRQYTANVYALEEGAMPKDDYVAGAQTIIKTQTAVAVQRLHTVLRALIN